MVGSLSSDFQRAEAEGLVEDLLDELLALDAVEQRVLGVAQVLDDPADVPPHGVAGQVLDAGEVEPLDQLGVDLPLEFVEVLAAAPPCRPMLGLRQPRDAARRGCSGC